MDDQGLMDNLDLTQRRKQKSRNDWKYGRTALLDPSVKHHGDLMEATRIFGSTLQGDPEPAIRLPPTEEAQGVKLGPTARAGIWSNRRDLTKALKVEGEPQTNNRGELAAVMWALTYAPKEKPLIIRADSTYVINGLMDTRTSWEDKGWLEVENQDLWKIALQELRNRRATTEIAKVKAHSQIFGNDEADRLAKEGAYAPPSDDLNIALDDKWQFRGARLLSLTFNQAYKWVRAKAGAEETAPRAKETIEGTKLLMREIHNIHLTGKELWRSIRADAVRREISDFL
ncbi:hypothetical protein FS837_008696, partial [Tulasnella sp. UAMH 9824]